jgi:uncharacterized protein (TIGR03437 family)
MTTSEGSTMPVNGHAYRQVFSTLLLTSLTAITAALFLSAPLHAQISQNISVTCTGSGQFCTPFYTTVITAPQAGTMTLTYTVPLNACATWRVHIYVDSTMLGTTGFLQAPALSSGPIAVNVTAGSHTIGLQAEGETGGCDTGTLSAWSGTLSIQLPSSQAAPPFISSLSPGSTTPGGAGFTLTVNGSGFVNGAVVQWTSPPVPTTSNYITLSTNFVSTTQLTAAVPPSLIANAGAANITVVNGPNGMPSNAVTFLIIQAGTPTITSVLNAASYSPQICPGAQALVSGTNLGTNFGPPPAGTTVTVGSKAGFVVAEGGAPAQIIVQIPFEASPGQTTMTVSFNGVTSTPYSITLASYCPALITTGPNGTGNVLILPTPGSPTPGGGPPGTPITPGATLTMLATGLGPTNPPTATGAAGTMNPTATPVSMAIGGTAVPSSNIIYAGTGNAPPGNYLIQFKVPNNVQGIQPIVISVGGVSSSSLATLPLTGIDALVSNASFGSAGTAAPGSIVSIFTSGLGNTDQKTGFPASNFQGVQVTFNGTAAPLFHLIASVTPQQIDLLVPDELPTSGNVNVQLSTPTSVSPNYVLTMAPAVPALYRLPDPADSTRFNVIAQFANTAWLALPVSETAAFGFPACLPSTNPLTLCGQPATPGDYLVIYATGLGKATPGGDPNGAPLVTGAIPPVNGSVLYETPTKPTVTIGGVTAPVLYSGLAPGFPGEYQVDVQVPPGVANGDDTPVVITMGGLSDTATISIQPRYGTSGP